MLEKQLRLDWVVTEASTAEEVVDLCTWMTFPEGSADGGRDSPFHSGGHREQFDLLVLDENFGEGLMLGSSAARVLRAAGVDAPIIVCSGEFSTSGVAFTYMAATAVSSVSPSLGVAEGGTPVTVYGSGFSASAESLGALQCRFNASVVRGAYVSESCTVIATCAAPLAVIGAASSSMSIACTPA